ncbi:hypothetical protein GBA52_008267 [Prunus armeniaca]|nr:hypothetical protein GBA52_008267 [Prunus armeniaca]
MNTLKASSASARNAYKLLQCGDWSNTWRPPTPSSTSTTSPSLASDPQLPRGEYSGVQ